MEAAIQQDYIRLNLGCGAKVLDGYVNVDVTQRGGRNFKGIEGKQPEVISDIRTLPFDDNYADEAMAIHVVEHFYIWDVNSVLTEWHRVLKPGGKMIIEVPDLDKIVLHIMSGNRNPAFTLCALYGDPSENDPLMVHKWAYNARTLGKMMIAAGFKDVHRERAEYHMQEERDLRMVGHK